ncbi:tetratricopeptide repeat protein [Streptomyces sp. So13.3]|uniref:AfsR/SARP family transcriptional regulator n=1 Tax=Streptomyces TaxID=1883 RepID=UPI001105FF8C|nr:MULTISPECIES: BTAD domain-containing putative transcriptional regulator [Streptomyces]QNA70986.1 tetratricopeptide repeat protein [Streptomyces sp. So13.3]
MRYRFLGRLDVFDGTRWTSLPAAKQRSVLALLLINANHFVSADALIDELWGDQVPNSAAKSLQVYVHRVRRTLGSSEGALLTRSGGYELRVGPGETDADRFAALAAAGQMALADGRPTEALGVLSEALGLWRGRALGDVPPTMAVLAESTRLEECRLSARQAMAEAKLAAGRHGELAAELGALLAEQPLHESLWATLMIALHRSGRRSEALQAFASARRLLRDELGVAPGARLQEALRTVLDDDRGQPGKPLCQLPPAVLSFVGRRRHLDRVLGLLGGPPAGVSRVVVVTGVAGVGKSAFAVHTAHLLRNLFPDGQLYADLRTFAQQSAEPGALLSSLLRALGVNGTVIPEGLDERSRLYRSTLADRRILVVLDNVHSEWQLRPLMPGTEASALLATSRSALAGLEGALRLDLGLLPDNEARTLLERAAGDDRIRRSPGTAARIIHQCGNLPLALRIVGARLATRPHLSPARIADALDDERRRLDELVAGDLEVRASVSLSYEHLAPAAERAFRLLGELTVPSIPGWVVGALLDSGPAETEAALDTLVDNRLLEVTAADATGEPRFRMHSLVRLCAREQSAAHEAPAERAAALTRVCAAYLHLAQRAAHTLASGFADPLPAPSPAWLPQDADRLLTGPLSWLSTERGTLCALVHQAEPRTAWQLAAALADYCESSAHFDDWRHTHETALAAARNAGDLLGEAVMYRGLGELNTAQDRYSEAITCFRRSLDTYAQRGQPDPGEAAAAVGLGVLLRLRGRYQEAVSYLQRGIAGARTTGNLRTEAYALCALGTVHLECGRTSAARIAFERALALSSNADYPMGEFAAQRCLGLVELATGGLDAARQRLELARRIAAAQRNHVGEVHVLQWLGHLTDLRGEAEHAESILDGCLAAYRRFGERFGEAITLRALADLYLHDGRRTAAMDAARQSLAIWRRLGSPYWTARTLDVIADIYEQQDAGDQARHEATALRISLGLPPGLRPATTTTSLRNLGGHLALVP